MPVDFGTNRFSTVHIAGRDMLCLAFTAVAVTVDVGFVSNIS